MTKAPLLASGSDVVLKHVHDHVLIGHHLRNRGDYLKDVMNRTRDEQLKAHLGKVLAFQKIVIKYPE